MDGHKMGIWWEGEGEAAQSPKHIIFSLPSPRFLSLPSRLPCSSLSKHANWFSRRFSPPLPSASYLFLHPPSLPPSLALFSILLLLHPNHVHVPLLAHLISLNGRRRRSSQKVGKVKSTCSSSSSSFSWPPRWCLVMAPDLPRTATSNPL